MEGKFFSIAGILLLLAGIILSFVCNFKYNGEHNPAISGYKEQISAEKELRLASIISISTGYLLSFVGFAMNKDSIHYTAKPRHHYHPSHHHSHHHSHHNQDILGVLS